MADANGAAFSFYDAAPSVVRGATDIGYGRIAFYGPTGAQSAAGDGTALVVHQPVPRHARTTPLRRMHQIVKLA
jgi:hypothetical protein